MTHWSRPTQAQSLYASLSHSADANSDLNQTSQLHAASLANAKDTGIFGQWQYRQKKYCFHGRYLKKSQVDFHEIRGLGREKLAFDSDLG